jgi:hypothetical protein
MALADGFWEFLADTRKPQSPDSAQPLSDHEQTSSLPAPISHGVQNGPIKSRSIINLLISFAMAIHGIVILAWLLLCRCLATFVAASSLHGVIFNDSNRDKILERVGF